MRNILNIIASRFYYYISNLFKLFAILERFILYIVILFCIPVTKYEMCAVGIFAYLYFLEFLVTVQYMFLGLFIACVLSSGYLTLISKLTKQSIIFHE
jgi:hypothetical protein